MSAADVAPAGAGGTPLAARVTGRAVRAWCRLLASELHLVFRQWRHLALLGALAVLPIGLGVALRLSTPQGGGGNGGDGPVGSLINQLAGNGVFLAFIALTIMLVLALPLTMAVVSGYSVAGEASSGTLRYLLAVPAGRTRLLFVKYLAVVIYALAAVTVVVGVSLILGLSLFPVGPVTLLSGTTVSLA